MHKLRIFNAQIRELQYTNEETSIHKEENFNAQLRELQYINQITELNKKIFQYTNENFNT